MVMFFIGVITLLVVAVLFAAIVLCIVFIIEAEKIKANELGRNSGYNSGWNDAERDYIEQAIEHGFARYGPTTGEFEWLEWPDIAKIVKLAETQSATPPAPAASAPPAAENSEN